MHNDMLPYDAIKVHQRYHNMGSLENEAKLIESNIIGTADFLIEEKPPLKTFTKPVLPLTRTLNFFKDQWGEEATNLLCIAGDYFSHGYNRWQLNRTERIPNGKGFEGFFLKDVRPPHDVRLNNQGCVL